MQFPSSDETNRESQEKLKRKSGRKFGLSIFAFFLFIIFFIVACTFSLLGGVTMLKHTALSLEPPPYPNSTLVSEGRSGASCCLWVTKVYHVSDPIDDVIAYMRPYFQDMPDRINVETQCLSGSRSSDGISANFADNLGLQSPIAEVTICLLDGQEDMVTISLRMIWGSF